MNPRAELGPVMLTPAERDALAVLTTVDRLGPVGLERLLEAYGSARAVLEAALRPGADVALREASRPLPAGPGRPIEAAAAEGVCVAARRAPAILRDLAAQRVAVVALGEPSYPRRLLAIELPPRILFVRGDAGALDPAAAVAIVGTRHPTDGGRRSASRIAAAVTRAGALVVSGLAVGIDGASHAAAVAERRPTVAVIGSGHARLFPRAHDRLAEAIVETGGAVISEHPPGTLPTRGTFPRRNRLISGLADAVVVVEAPARSGALLTAAWALEQGRECFFVPGAIDAPQSAGCLAWLRDYAGAVRIVAGVPQLLEDLGLSPAAAFAMPGQVASGGAARRPRSPGVTPPPRPTRLPGAGAQVASLAPREAAIAEWLIRGASTVDELMTVTKLGVGQVLAGLTTLEEDGLVVGWSGSYRPAGALAGVEREVGSPEPAGETAGGQGAA